MPRTGMSAPELKEKAIKFALQRMRKEGFDKVRLTDIAKDLGVSHAALYGHFADKSALLDAVSEQWLTRIDEAQEILCGKKKEPITKLHNWFLNLHQRKREKVLNDPEIYKSFDMAAESMKPFVVRHLENVHRQLHGLVKEAMAEKKLRKADPETVVNILTNAMMGFTHPKLVVQFLAEKREPLLRQTLDTVIRGLA